MTRQVAIHCKPSYFNSLQQLGLRLVDFDNNNDREVITIVNDNDISDDEEFVSSYGIDYDFVNSIELI